MHAPQLHLIRHVDAAVNCPKRASAKNTGSGPCKVHRTAEVTPFIADFAQVFAQALNGAARAHVGYRRWP
jgi:hypothetical protein